MATKHTPCTPFQALFEREREEAINSTLSLLNPDLEIVIRMRLLEDKSRVEVAAILMISEDQVWQYEMNALRKLRQPSLSLILSEFVGEVTEYVV